MQVVKNESYLKLFSFLQENEFVEKTASGSAESELNEIHRFELLRNELIELEKRVQRNADQSDNEEVNVELLNNLYMIFLMVLHYILFTELFLELIP